MVQTNSLQRLLALLECLRICLNVVEAVIGGENATVGEFPHMALLGRPCSQSILVRAVLPPGLYVSSYRDGACTEYEWFCGGTLISNQYVLTAGHCAHPEMMHPPMVVRLGEHDLSDGAEGNVHQDFGVRTIVPHPDINGPQSYNDIALVQLDRIVPFDRFIQPACLWTKDALPRGAPLIATGWGKFGYFEKMATVLQRVQLSYVSNAQCNELLVPNRRLPYGILPTQLCAGELLGGKDTCEGDSGGPLVLKRSSGGPNQPPNSIGQCRYQLVGITSHGGFCGTFNQPGIYTRVSAYLGWIERVVWGKGGSP